MPSANRAVTTIIAVNICSIKECRLHSFESLSKYVLLIRIVLCFILHYLHS